MGGRGRERELGGYKKDNTRGGRVGSVGAKRFILGWVNN